MASPCILKDPMDSEKQLALPTIKRTLNVLEAAKSFGVRRVVVKNLIIASLER